MPEDDSDREVPHGHSALVRGIADAEEAVGQVRWRAQHELRADAAMDGLDAGERADLAHELEQAARTLRHCARIADLGTQQCHDAPTVAGEE